MTITDAILLASGLVLASICVVGGWIGRFYQLKFSQTTHRGLLYGGAATGLAGYFGRLTPLPVIIWDLAFILGAVLIGAGTFWLWFVMLGPRR